ncbi:MAG: class I SAM-dependent DNA methyltransferase [Acholeplasmataceae bacterium]|nr:class I SAM-dependent DNA methyltransferase [Acholeplasmataceae bacterium]
MRIDYSKIEANIEKIIDELKGICSQSGLGNTGAEERIITTVFLYKFLNDKFMYNLHEFEKEIGIVYKEILMNKHNEMDAFYDRYSGNVAFNYEDTIEYLVTKMTSNEFYKDFDTALTRISKNPRNDNFNIETSDGTKKPLFEEISREVDESAKNNFVKSIFASITQERFDFTIGESEKEDPGHVFKKHFDFYSRIFEYLIKDYNVSSGKYAEYFTPQAVSKIIAKILVGMSEKIDASEIYDPSAGSGSLVLHLANELGAYEGISRALVYTQDISQKSSRFLRINLLLNGLTDSLHNVIQGDTLFSPSHYTREGDPQSGLKKFDYIVSNPPFKLDFSSTRDSIEQKWKETKNETGLHRFFAGVPAIAKKKKESMAIYLLFIQHIIFSLKSKGKAAIVVPTGFITAKNGIEAEIRKYIVKNKILKGCISMPSNIFANTGTNVSVLFLDKANESNEVFLMDASGLGTKQKEGKNQKTVLSHDEEDRIIDSFINKREIEEFSKIVSYEQIQEKKNSFSVGQYFEVKIEYIDITKEEFEQKMAKYEEELKSLILKSQELDNKIIENFSRLKFNDKKEND